MIRVARGEDSAALCSWFDRGWAANGPAPTQGYYKAFAYPGSNDGWFVQIDLEWMSESSRVNQPMVTVRVHSGLDKALEIVGYMTRWLYQEARP